MATQEELHWIQRFEQKLDQMHLRMDSSAEKIDEKLCVMEEKSEARHANLHAFCTTEFSALNTKWAETSTKLTKHENYFSIVGFLVTSGIATFIAVITFVSGSIFPHKH